MRTLWSRTESSKTDVFLMLETQVRFQNDVLSLVDNYIPNLRIERIVLLATESASGAVDFDMVFTGTCYFPD